jgi:hypothetical protein
MRTLSKKYFFIILIAISSIALYTYATESYDFLHLKENNPSHPEWVLGYDIIRAKDAWNASFSSSEPLSRVTIGIIDRGVDAGHPEFDDVNFGNTPSSAKKDSDGHGTSIAGIIGANNISAFGSLPANSPQTNGILSGVLPVTRYTLELRDIKGSTPLFFESLKDIYTASELLHADVVNISRGELNSPVISATAMLYRLIFWRYSNTIFVFSAGNDGVNVENQTPANINLANTMTVGATDFLDKRFVLSATTSSNFGAGVDISAPGIVYAPTAQGKGELSDGDYTLFNSTSASAPLVTGVAGLLKAIKTSLTPAQIKDILIRTADPIFAETGSDEAEMPLGSGCTATNTPTGMTKRGCRLNALAAVCDADVLNCEPATTTGTLQGHTFRMLSDWITVIPEGGVSVYVKDNDTGTILAETTSDSNGLYTMAVIMEITPVKFRLYPAR